MSGRHPRRRADGASTSRQPRRQEPQEPDNPDLFPYEHRVADNRFMYRSEFATWERRWMSRKDIPEREFVLEDFPRQIKNSIRRIRDRRGWQRLMGRPGPRNLSMVREFYTQLNSTRDYSNKVGIRGRDVNFSEAAIHAYFRLPDTDNSLTICAENARSLEYQNEARRVFEDRPLPGWPDQPRSQDLKDEFYFWLHFVNIYLLPSTNASECYPGKYTLLHRIDSEEPINIGEHIRAKIFAIARSNDRRGRMPYPSLITALCTRAGVQPRSDDEMPPPEKIFDHTCIRRRVRGEDRGQAVADEEMHVDDQQDPQPMPPQDQSQYQQQPPAMPATGPTQQMQVDFALATAQWHLYQGFNDLRQAVDSSIGRQSDPLQFHYHGYPFAGYYAQHPESFAADSTDRIPEFHVPYMQPGQQFPAGYGQHPQGFGQSQFAGAHPMSGQGGHPYGQSPDGSHFDYFGQQGGYSGSQFGGYPGVFPGGSSDGGGDDTSAPVYHNVSDDGSGNTLVLSDTDRC